MQIIAYINLSVYNMQLFAYYIMNEIQIIYIHLYTVIPAFVIGTYLMMNHKGTSAHRMLGKLYMLLMLSTAVASLFIPAYIGPRLLNHFGFIHLLSLLVIYSIPIAYYHIRKGRVALHRSIMVQVYIGALLIAGGLAVFSPGRMLNTWLMSFIN